MWRLAVGLLVCLLCAAAEIPRAEYAARRQELRKHLDNSILVLFGNTGRDVDEMRTGFYQEPNFYYLTGWNQPSAILLLTPDRETLFLPKRNQTVERYTGAKVAAGDAAARGATGFEQVLSLAEFEKEFAHAIESHENILTLRSRRQAGQLDRLAPLRQIGDAARIIHRQRARKSAAEIEWIQKATDVTAEAHRTAWKRIQPGLYEYQVAATMLLPMHEAGCRAAYTPIVASGPNGTVLHYAENSRRMDSGELILMDVAAACGEYASDVTRTVPVSGRFTPRQREIYVAVLGAQRAAIEAVKPGATMRSINRAARAWLEEHGKLGKYLTHGISHGVGLEAHDAPAHTSTEPFEPGMVITIEPGVYIPEEKLGIRIEDVVVVTDSGARVLSAALPKEPADIEKAMAGQ
jgi:Xaa-Pro aminopeptidase